MAHFHSFVKQLIALSCVYGVRSCDDARETKVIVPSRSNGVVVAGATLRRTLRLNLGSEEAASCSHSNLCHECGSTVTSSLLASPVLNALVHMLLLPQRVLCTW